MAKHMDDKDRGRIEYLLDCGKSVTEIAKDLGRPDSTVSREIQSRRIDSEKRYGCSNRLCSRFEECELQLFDGFSSRIRKNSARCFEHCPRFFEAVCERWAKAPYVCNGCEKEPSRRRGGRPATRLPCSRGYACRRAGFQGSGSWPDQSIFSAKARSALPPVPAHLRPAPPYRPRSGSAAGGIWRRYIPPYPRGPPTGCAHSSQYRP